MDGVVMSAKAPRPDPDPGRTRRRHLCRHLCVAVRNLSVLHRAVTPEAVREEVERLARADRVAGCLGDVWWKGYLPDSARALRIAANTPSAIRADR